MTGRHAYLIQAHSHPEQLKILLSLLDDARNDIFVHLDAKCSLEPTMFEGCCRHSSLFFTDRIKVNWAGPSQVWSELILMETASAREKYSYYHLLSGMDLPIKSQDDIHAFFERNAGKEFLMCEKVEYAHTFVRFQWAPFAEYASKPILHLCNEIVRQLSYRILGRRHPEIQYGYGANWFSLTDPFVRYILEHRQWIYDVFSGTRSADEHFAQTLMLGSAFESSLVKDNLRKVDFERSGSARHPYVFRMDDYGMLMECSELFARKFDMDVDGKIIIKIYEALKKD